GPVHPGPNPSWWTITGPTRDPRPLQEDSLSQGRGTFRWRRRRDRRALRDRRERWRTGSPFPSDEGDGRSHRREHDHGKERRDEGPVQGAPWKDVQRLADRRCDQG